MVPASVVQEKLANSGKMFNNRPQTHLNNIFFVSAMDLQRCYFLSKPGDKISPSLWGVFALLNSASERYQPWNRWLFLPKGSR
jgi:hypothetical protein